MVTKDYFDAWPNAMREHLACRLVDAVIPVTQKHGIAGLVMGPA
jgi:hypothetical protein